MTVHGEWLQNIKVPPKSEIIIANNDRIQIAAVGDVQFNIFSENTNDVEPVYVKNVLHVPNLSTNLLSVSQMCSNGKRVVFDVDGCKIYNEDSVLVATAKLEDNMYKLNRAPDQLGKKNKCMTANNVYNEWMLWHRRLGHMNFDYMRQLQNISLPFCDKQLSVYTKKPCVVCLKGKQAKQPFKNTGTRATKVLQIVHSDVCGPMEIDSLSGSRYFVTMIDDYTRKTFVYFLKSKNEVKESFLYFKNAVENETGQRIQILRTDGGTEYQPLDKLLRESGIQHQITVPYTPEQNGVAERQNRSIVERARCLLFDAKLQKQFWAEAVSTAVFIMNRSPTKALSDKLVPEEVWSNKKQDMKFLRIFGCKAMAHVPSQKRKKWDAKSTECIFVGYPSGTKGYRLYVPETQKIILSRNVVFIETDNDILTLNGCNDEADLDAKKESEMEFFIRPEENTVQVGVNELKDDNSQICLNENLSQIINEDDCCEPSQAESDFYGFSDEEEQNINVQAVVKNSKQRHSSRKTELPKKFDNFVMKANTSELSDPLTVQEALSRSDEKFWREAMKSEYDSLIENETWTLVNLTSDRKAIDCKWVFKTKIDASGKLRYKARLVIKGCAQTKGIDYSETYSTVVRYTSIRYLMALASKFDLDIDHMDAVTAFLQGDLNEDIYMLQPVGYGNGTKVCKLKKALYGLKQASRVWNIKLDKVLTNIGFKRSKVDPCIYYNIEKSKMIFLAVYVDDLLLFSNCAEIKDKVKMELNNHFKMKDFGEAKSCLGINITRDREKHKIWIDQEKYINEVLIRFNMSNCNPVSTPCDINLKLSKEMCPKNTSEINEMECVPYQQAVGSILYAAQGTRPDIAYAVSIVSRFNNNPGRQHWNAVKRILRYLKGTSSMKLEFSKYGNSDLMGYCDADWAGDIDERRSVTGYVFMMQGGPLSWNSKKQPTVALSTTEAEYMALSAATQEAMWLKNFENEFQFGKPKSVKILCDNKSALDLAATNGYHARTKHIDIRHHYVRKCVEDQKIKIASISTDQMVADILTKGLSKDKHTSCCSGLGLLN